MKRDGTNFCQQEPRLAWKNVNFFKAFSSGMSRNPVYYRFISWFDSFMIWSMFIFWFVYVTLRHLIIEGSMYIFFFQTKQEPCQHNASCHSPLHLKLGSVRVTPPYATTQHHHHPHRRRHRHHQMTHIVRLHSYSLDLSSIARMFPLTKRLHGPEKWGTKHKKIKHIHNITSAIHPCTLYSTWLTHQRHLHPGDYLIRTIRLEWLHVSLQNWLCV